MNQPNSLAESLAAVGEDGTRALQELGLPADATILDVGTGSGKFAIWLATQGFRVLTGEPATDTTHYAGRDWAANAEEAGVRDRIRFEHFDASDMPFEPESFDAVFFFGVLHHVAENIRGDVFREALRVAKKDGAVVFFEPRKVLLDKMWESDPGHPHAADPSEYLPDPAVHERRVEGSRMNIFIYRHAAA
jgi:ubiquinone/menaquinone biosynthesis C-methylase UbiE